MKITIFNLFVDETHAFDYSAVECKDEVLPSIQTTARHDKRMQKSADSPPTIQLREEKTRSGDSTRRGILTEFNPGIPTTETVSVKTTDQQSIV
jgi:hypothetical protein